MHGRIARHGCECREAYTRGVVLAHKTRVASLLGCQLIGTASCRESTLLCVEKRKQLFAARTIFPGDDREVKSKLSIQLINAALVGGWTRDYPIGSSPAGYLIN